MTQALVLVVLTFVSVELARRLAAHKGRARVVWMWSAALLGPLPLLVLAILPTRPRPA